MMNTQLTVDTLLVRAEKYFAKKEVVSRTSTGITRLTYGDFAKRTRALASALETLGVKNGDRVGTFAWNDHRHLEAYFAIPSMGAVLHTINIRLSSDHLKYIINDAKDRILLIDEGLLPLIENIKDDIPTVEAFIIFSDNEELPYTNIQSVYHYEKLLKQGNIHFKFPDNLNENDPAGMCYTSATTGNPKGVLYTHRSIVLHSMMLGLADTFGISESDRAMHVVPMFHVNAWGFPFASVWFGAVQVLPGPNFTFKTIGELIETEKVTVTAGVPTIWIGLLNELESNRYDLSSLRYIVCGGSAMPKGVIRTFKEKYNITFVNSYGATESSPVATISKLKSHQQEIEAEDKLELSAIQGIPVPGMELKVLNAEGEVEQNGKDMGEVLLRGPWVTDKYYNKPDKTAEAVKDGWLHTGDIATVDAEGNIKIVDRTKDLIKSGGEWISSVDLENALMAHEGVSEAAVISVPHEKWQERPVAFVVKSRESINGNVTKEMLLEFLEPQFVKWWLPDDIIFIDEIPKTSVGKFLKRKLRSDFKDYYITG